MIIELKIEIPEFLLICAPARNKLFPIFVNVALGPIAVILLNIALVFGVAVVPAGLLSLSNASEVEISAIRESRMYQAKLNFSAIPIISIKIIILCFISDQVFCIYGSTKPFISIIFCIGYLDMID